MRCGRGTGVAAVVVALAVAAGCGGDAERITSARYGYSIALDPAMTQPAAAAETWDGRSGVAHGTSVVDEYDLANGDFFFAYGGPTDSGAAEFAAERHRRAVRDHGCDESPETTETQLDGEAAVRLDMRCSGVHIQWMVAVHDGRGLVLVLGADPAREDENRATFERLVSTVRWA